MHYYWYGTDSVSDAAAANTFVLAAEREPQDYISQHPCNVHLRFMASLYSIHGRYVVTHDVMLSSVDDSSSFVEAIHPN